MTPVLEVLLQHRLFESLPKEDFQYLFAISSESRHPRRSMVFRQGEPCTGFFVVVNGMVRLYKAAPDGREHVVEVIRQGQSFAEAVVFTGDLFPVNAETLEDSHLLFFPREPFLHYLEERPRLLFGMIGSISVRMHQLVTKLERLTLQDARQRVAGYFTDLCERTPRAEALDLSKKTLAAQLGLTPETLSRTLHDLQEEGLISMDGRHFRILDAEALTALSKG
ncbi:MAG: Crp/Fnr family transcriptional regulator [Leptospirillia bacterium]